MTPIVLCTIDLDHPLAPYYLFVLAVFSLSCLISSYCLLQNSYFQIVSTARHATTLAPFQTLRDQGERSRYVLKHCSLWCEIHSVAM